MQKETSILGHRCSKAFKCCRPLKAQNEESRLRGIMERTENKYTAKMGILAESA